MPLKLVSLTRFEPSAALSQISSWPVWSETSAIDLPSGEYIGHDSRPLDRRIARSSDCPSTSDERQMAATVGLSEYASRLPVRETAGYCACLPAITRSLGLP